jgi:tRNA pseudouridine55 synthase
VIADDFGKMIGCGAYLKSLRRTAIGDYSVEDAFTLEELNIKLTLN